MAGSAGPPSTVTISEKITAGLALGNFAMGTNSLIADAETCVLEGNGALLPLGWAQKLYSMIDEAEAQIRNCQPSFYDQKYTHQQNRDSCDSTEVRLRSSKQINNIMTEDSLHGHNGGVRAISIDLTDERRESADSVILAELDNSHAHIEQNFVLAEPQSKLEEIQEDVYALQSVISIQMADFRSLKKRQTSELAWFSILEEEYEILLDLGSQIEDLYEPWDGMGEGLAHELLQVRFDALPIQLQAVFNMRCQEGERQRREIDDEEMVHMVLENQTRTEMLRNIQNLLERKKNVMQEKAKIDRR
ncbi:hypothetical protein VM1G_06585 [Cytospora mali]|uniref:Uncharacterized protein n=1 Tax=Cytospora mali TaxID=578113 RepID=A0A194W318_CYTMA|nr:hypothetical protein VM1G_06585 [Valsa mali]